MSLTSRIRIIAPIACLSALLAACGGQEAGSPATKSTVPEVSSGSSAPAGASPSGAISGPTSGPEAPALGPTGFGALTLGMERQQAEATGLIEPS
jgi:hypothetical protein